MHFPCSRRTREQERTAREPRTSVQFTFIGRSKPFDRTRVSRRAGFFSNSPPNNEIFGEAAVSLG